ncbi:ABC transporter permease [Clostridium grantii]|uniref:Ribose transport system permease protein n=1 Tax=Clostridium grantii DSM 8605 TaxID=1121316 RepID=A0A1M5V678_9CLOT|nr:ABC transporter permease [Clostridium grantii]SHH70769.1 ribose transport system permease protein [Clostridium grantii DSM 8605]
MNKVNNNNKNQVNKLHNTLTIANRYPTVFIVLLLTIAFSVISPFFFTGGNMKTIMAGNAIIMIAAIGETLVLLTGGIDLSISTVVSASAVLSGTVMLHTGNIFLGLIVALSVGIIFGLFNGILIGYCGMTPFITTMGTQLVARGIAFIVSQGIAVKGTPEALMNFGFSFFAGIPSVTVISIVMIIISSVLLTKTTWGREVILFGSNRKTAEYTGIDVRKLEMSVYLLSGLFAGVAGFISIANLGNAIPGVGDTILLIIIGGVVIGGTSMNGGEGSIIRTVIGVGLLAILTNGLNLIGVPFYDQLIIQGILIFIGNAIATKLSEKSPYAM